jgi:hypothetical protein
MFRLPHPAPLHSDSDARQGITSDSSDSTTFGIGSKAGQELAPIVRRLSQWGERWVLGHIDPRKPDVTALMWALRRRVDPSAFGKRRVTVQFEFTDQPQAKRCWWLVNEGTSVDLCPKDPGFEVDLYVVTNLQTMARVWVGKLQLSAAINASTLDLSDPRSLCKAFCSWLLLSPFAQREATEPEHLSAGAAVGPTSRAGRKSRSTRGASLSTLPS